MSDKLYLEAVHIGPCYLYEKPYDRWIGSEDHSDENNMWHLKAGQTMEIGRPSDEVYVYSKQKPKINEDGSHDIRVMEFG